MCQGFTYSVTEVYTALGRHPYPHVLDEETWATQLVSAEPGLEPRSVSSKAGALSSPFTASY